MGLKGKVLIAVGTGVVLTIAGLLGYKKEKDERNEKIQKTIREVDLKEPEKKEEVNGPKTVEEITDDVDEAMCGMDIGGDEVTQVTDAEADRILKEGRNVLDKVNAFFGDTEENRQKQQDLNDHVEKMRKEVAKDIKYFEEEWPKKVEDAVKRKDFSKMEKLFDEKYAGGPWHPSPASVYGDAFSDGVIDEKTYNAARKYYDRLWCYSGD